MSKGKKAINPLPKPKSVRDLIQFKQVAKPEAGHFRYESFCVFVVPLVPSM